MSLSGEKKRACRSEGRPKLNPTGARELMAEYLSDLLSEISMPRLRGARGAGRRATRRRTRGLGHKWRIGGFVEHVQGTCRGED